MLDDAVKDAKWWLGSPNVRKEELDD